MINKLTLIEEILQKKLAHLSKDGALVVETGKYTGRATQHRYIVERKEILKEINWGKINKKLAAETFELLVKKMELKLQKQKCYTYEGYIGGLKVKIYTSSPWHALFAINMFREERLTQRLLKTEKTIHIFHDPYKSTQDYGIDTGGDVIIALDLLNLKICIAGTAYAGEIKKSCFTMCNYFLPKHDILPMHASANCLNDGSNSCVLFGLSGTGKTTLSTSLDRYLIGDDEIIWSKNGLSNLEGGCYAKLIDLSKTKEAEIFKAANSFGSILENVVMDKNTRTVNFADKTKTENTRGSYELDSLSKVFEQSQSAQHPNSIIFLTADAFGALPAVAKLNNEQIIYYFISGYTAKVAGTELGIKQPEHVFSSCFGAPFMPRHPMTYAKLLDKYIKKTKASVWLLNTGWTGGDYKTGCRFPIEVSRTLVKNIQQNRIGKDLIKHPIFGFYVPKTCNGVDNKYLQIPEGPQVKKLALSFIKNMETIFKGETLQGGPVVS